MFLGIDVSKATLDVALLTEQDARKASHKVLTNPSEAHQQLLVLSAASEMSAFFPISLFIFQGRTVSQAVLLNRACIHKAGFEMKWGNTGDHHVFGDRCF